MPDIEVHTRTAAVSGAPGPAPERPRVELVLSTDTGAETVRADGSKAPSRAESIARIRDAATKGGGGKTREEPAGQGSEGDEADEGAGDQADEEEEDAEAAGQGDEDAAADEEEGDEEEPAADEEEPAAAKPDEAPAFDFDGERDRLEREVYDLQDQIAALQSGAGAGVSADDRELYLESPVAFVKKQLGAMFGLDEKDPDLREALVGLLTDLTVDISSGQISSEKLSQIKTERTGLAWRLEKKAQRAAKERPANPGGNARSEAAEVEGYIGSVYQTVASKFPHVALSVDLDGEKPERLIARTLKNGVARGIIRMEGKTEAELVEEAIRLANHSLKTRAAKIAARTSALAPAPGSAASGKQKPASSAAPKADPSAKTKKPRTLSAAEAATPPKTSGKTKTPQNTGPRVIEVVRDPDAEEARRAAIFAKHRRTK